MGKQKDPEHKPDALEEFISKNGFIALAMILSCMIFVATGIFRLFIYWWQWLDFPFNFRMG